METDITDTRGILLSDDVSSAKAQDPMSMADSSSTSADKQFPPAITCASAPSPTEPVVLASVMHLFLDTSTLIETRMHLGPGPLLTTVFEGVQDGLVELHSTTITMCEVREVLERKLRELADLDLRHKKEFSPTAKDVELPSAETILSGYREHVGHIHAGGATPLTSLVTLYEEKFPPFQSSKKPDEIKDAIAALSLQEWATANGSRIHVMANDKDWPALCGTSQFQGLISARLSDLQRHVNWPPWEVVDRFETELALRGSVLLEDHLEGVKVNTPQRGEGSRVTIDRIVTTDPRFNIEETQLITANEIEARFSFEGHADLQVSNERGAVFIGNGFLSGDMVMLVGSKYRIQHMEVVHADLTAMTRSVGPRMRSILGLVEGALRAP